MPRYLIAFSVFFLLLLVIVAASLRQPSTPPQTSPRIVQRVLIISIDGLRPDLALRGDMPNLHGLLQESTYSFWARTTEMSITLPSHTSMITGVTPGKHGITWNDDREQIVYPNVPTLMETAKQHGMSTALVAGKSKFITLARPGTIDYLALPEPRRDEKGKLDAGTVNAETVGAATCEILVRHRPDLTFVHFADPDTAGHALAGGWGSPLQMTTIANVDRALGAILETLRANGMEESTLLIISADHGGQGRVHGPNDPRSRHIPWIVRGPYVRHNFDLTRIEKLTINTEDTCATAAYFLGLPRAAYLDGKPITDIIDPAEPAPTPITPASHPAVPASRN